MAADERTAGTTGGPPVTMGLLDSITSLQNGADLLWIETEKPHIDQIAGMVDRIRQAIPTAISRSLSLSPSRTWPKPSSASAACWSSRRGTPSRATTSRSQPDYADAHDTLGAVLKSTRDYKGAATSLRRAIALRPDLPAARYTLGQVLQLSGDARGAREQFAEAERLRLRAQAERAALARARWRRCGHWRAATP